MKLITDNGKEIKITDVLVGEITPDTLMMFRYPGPIPLDIYNDITKSLKEKFPNNHILVVDARLDLELYTNPTSAPSSSPHSE